MNTRLTPTVDPLSAPFWAATARHELLLPRCRTCREIDFPPASACARCGGPGEYDYTPASGRGRLHSWAVVHRSFVPGFEGDLPFVLADVELDEPAPGGVRMIGRLLDGASPSYLARVHVVFEDLSPDVALVAFALEQ